MRQYGVSSRLTRHNGWRSSPTRIKGYVDGDRAEAIRTMVSENVPVGSRGAPKHGSALLSGLLRCRRCGRKLCVQYTGVKGQIPRYACVRGRLDQGEPNCIAFGGLRVDDVVEKAVLTVVQPIGRALEGAHAMGLEMVRSPDPLHRLERQAAHDCHGPPGPVRSGARRFSCEGALLVRPAHPPTRSRAYRVAVSCRVAGLLGPPRRVASANAIPSDGLHQPVWRFPPRASGHPIAARSGRAGGGKGPTAVIDDLPKRGKRLRRQHE